jgi:YidC/Oxa1 family membrane protein insertase
VVQPGGTYTHVSRLFAGAKTVPVLRTYEDTLGIPRFEDAVDWGRLFFITKPAFWLLEVFNGLLGSFGLAILALTVVVKLLMFYPANLSYESLTKMKKVQPQVEELRARWKDDPQKQQQELMRLYQSEKINPLMGCLPMLATIPVFLALFKVLSVAIEMRHAPFYGWIQDLSSRDPTTLLNLFGLIPWDPATTPFIGGFLNTYLHIGVWPLAYGVTQWLSMKMSPPAPDPIQQRIMELMPVIFTFVLASLSVGLMIYYTWSNILTILQQYVIMRKYQVDNPIDDFLNRLKARKAPG